MNDIVIIKFFKPEYTSADFHDLYMEGELGDADADIAELKNFGKKINKTILFSVCNTIDVAWIDGFAEISYSGTISDEEKQFYVNIIKRFSRDAKVNRRGELKVDSIPVTICLNKMELPEIIEA